MKVTLGRIIITIALIQAVFATLSQAFSFLSLSTNVGLIICSILTFANGFCIEILMKKWS